MSTTPAADLPDHSAEKNRYLAAPRQADFTIDQQWTSYSAAEHDRWDRLFARAETTLKNRACDEYISALHGSGLRELMEDVVLAYKATTRELPTPELNRVLADMRALAYGAS